MFRNWYDHMSLFVSVGRNQVCNLWNSIMFSLLSCDPLFNGNGTILETWKIVYFNIYAEKPSLCSSYQALLLKVCTIFCQMHMCSVCVIDWVHGTLLLCLWWRITDRYLWCRQTLFIRHTVNLIKHNTMSYECSICKYESGGVFRM